MLAALVLGQTLHLHSALPIHYVKETMSLPGL
jgi:hypothetical protein